MALTCRECLFKSTAQNSWPSSMLFWLSVALTFDVSQILCKNASWVNVWEKMSILETVFFIILWKPRWKHLFFSHFEASLATETLQNDFIFTNPWFPVKKCGFCHVFHGFELLQILAQIRKCKQKNLMSSQCYHSWVFKNEKCCQIWHFYTGWVDFHQIWHYWLQSQKCKYFGL